MSAIFQNGLLNAVDPHRERQLVFWFLLASPLLFLMGQMIYSRTPEQKIPTYIGWELLALILFCGLLMPVSGFWLLLVPALLLVKK